VATASTGFQRESVIFLQIVPLWSPSGERSGAKAFPVTTALLEIYFRAVNFLESRASGIGNHMFSDTAKPSVSELNQNPMD
jgi:hypothetical protein